MTRDLASLTANGGALVPPCLILLEALAGLFATL